MRPRRGGRSSHRARRCSCGRVGPSTSHFYRGNATAHLAPENQAQDFTVINVTPEQIATRMVKFEPAPLSVVDFEHVRHRAGLARRDDYPRPDDRGVKEEVKEKGLF